MTSHELPPPNIIITGNPKDVTITTSFGFGCGGHLVTTEEYLSEENFNYPYKKSIATAGILRGSGECVKKAEEFWYIDHGYFHRTKHPPDCDGYYRVGHNTLWSSGEGDYTWDRFNSFKIELGFCTKNARRWKPYNCGSSIKIYGSVFKSCVVA